ncbi:MAG: trypsin-like peptidase domain-containing protein [Roseibacillus sp.]
MMKKSKSKLSWARSSLVVLGLGLASTTVATGQQLEAHLRLNGSEVRKAFEPLRAILQQSSAVVYDGWKSVAYGVVISSDGYLLTKATEIEGAKDLNVRVDQAHFKSVKVVATTVEWDVALLKVEAEDLVPVTWSNAEEPTHGTWVVSNGSTSRTRRRVRVGIISANAREVGGKAPVVLGITLKTDKEDNTLSIREVQDESGAAAAGLEAGDVILSADGKEVGKIEELLEVLSDKEPGDRVKIVVKRDDEEKEFDVELLAREKVFEEQKTRNDQMSGRYSKRRSNFKRVLQHDLPLSARSVGGPLLDLDGKCIGMNIARVNRSETFAIPATELQLLIGEFLQKEGGS